jgi:hypothetical protein
MIAADESWAGEMPDYTEGDYHFHAGCHYHNLGRLFTETKRVVWSWSDGSDEPSFAWIVELKDGRFVAVEGWHDCTGWDCQSGCDVGGIEYSVEKCARYLTEVPLFAFREALP